MIRAQFANTLTSWSIIALACLWLTSPSASMAATVTGEMTADFAFEINVSYGPGQTTNVVPTISESEQAHRIFFEVDATRLDTCTIQIIAWNNEILISIWAFLNAEGLIGHLGGNAGTVYTGGGSITYHNSGVNRAAGATIADYEAWLAASILPEQPISQFIRLLLTLFYAPPVFSAPPAGMDWIAFDTASSSESIYVSFVIPCSDVVLPETPVPNPLDDDHFACYVPIKPQDPSEAVALEIRDQFGPGEIKIGRPVLHCNPSEKTHDGVEFSTQNRERHLVCYEILEQSEIKPPHVRIENQIGTNNYIFENRREIFCVPSLKQEL